LFSICLIPTCCLGFYFFVSVNISLQHFTCIVFISCVVGFALSCYLLLSSCSLLDHFPCYCLGFRFVCFFKKILQQSTWGDSTKCTIQNVTNYTINMFQLHVSNIFVGFKFLYTCFNYLVNGSFQILFGLTFIPFFLFL
jgi:hypothetical protein